MSLKNVSLLNPPSTIGIVGGGQLGKMMAVEAKRMGFKVIVLDPKRNSPASQVSDEQILANFNDKWALNELARKSDVITYEFEHIDADSLSEIEERGYPVYPSAKTLKRIKNKFEQKTMLDKIGVSVPKFFSIKNINDLERAYNELGGKLILKTCTDGYDGKGNIVIKNMDELYTAYEVFKGFELIAEEFIDFDKEVSILIAKDNNEICFYPVAENVHKNSILIKTTVPARVSNDINEKIRVIGKKIMDELDDVGVFCIEFFVDSNGRVLVNEIAPRPHNSGHYTIEGCKTSQFEQIVRIVCGLPLGSTELRMPCAMYNILGCSKTSGAYKIRGVENVLSIPDCHFHLYGKPETDHLKKIGHITVLNENVDKADLIAEAALNSIFLEESKMI